MHTILMVASEAAPFSKTGGLADVVAALPAALGRLGHEVTVVTPRYRGVERGAAIGSLALRLGTRDVVVDLTEHRRDRVRTVLVDSPNLFDRDHLYGVGSDDYPDNALRFAILARAALAYGSEQTTTPDVIHAHDWQAGLVPVYLRAAVAPYPRLAQVPCVFTIHNLAYQGLFRRRWVPWLDVDPAAFTVDGLEYWGQISFLKGGVNFSAAITTVSPRYAEEIQTPELGFGFDGILRARRGALTGILNGIDTALWDPAHDPALPAPYDPKHLEGKAASKAELVRTFGLSADGALRRPVIAMISRLVDQKGFDLIVGATDELLRFDASFVLLGTGTPAYQDHFGALAAAHPDRVGVRIGFDERLAHLIEGGADMFLMPSRFEPCGLNQMYSLRYGTVPIVRAVGGLDNTVDDYDPATGRGTGFKFVDYMQRALLDAIARSVDAYRNPRIWKKLQVAGMKRDHSWDASAREYVKVYDKVTGRPAPHVRLSRGDVGPRPSRNKVTS